jgi:hypothetical protein
MFERLTARSPKNGMAYLINVKQNEQDVESPYPNTLRCIMDSFNRLAAYEDSGLTPEEVQELKVSVKICEDCWNHAQAKAEGRLVVLPCKIGDEVWFLEKQLDIANGTCSTVISEYIVTEIRGNKYNPLWYMASSEGCTHRDFHPTEIGKTVFLTKEAAEKALGGGESD